jgi:hypothetical protein
MTQQLLLKSTATAWYLEQSRNRLVRTQDFTNAVWHVQGVTLTAGQTDPLGGSTAALLTATAPDATLSQELNLPGDQLTRTVSFYLKRITGAGAVSLTLDGVTFTQVTLTGALARYDLSAAAFGTISPGILLSTVGDAITVAFAQVEDGSLTAYTANGENEYVVFSVNDPDYPVNTVRGAVFLDGRFFVMTPGGDIQQSALEDASTWSSLEFIKSQIDAGRGVYIARLKNYIVAFKDWSTEFFYDAANATGSILSPVQNAAFQIGCASGASVQEMSDTIVWMGQTRLGFGRGVYVLEGTEPKRISTPSVDKLLDQDALSQVYSWAASIGSHVLYGITLGQTELTLVYDFSSGLWSFFTYLEISGSPLYVESATSAGLLTTSASHGLEDGAIVKLAGPGGFPNSWHVATNISPNTLQIQTPFSAGAGWTLQPYTETYFPVVSSVRAEGRQFMQDAINGALYEFQQAAYRDAIGATPMRLRTPKIDDGSSRNKSMASAELVGDKVESTAVIRHSDDDYATYSLFRPVALGVRRSRIRRVGKMTRRTFEILHVGNALVRLEAIELGD